MAHGAETADSRPVQILLARPRGFCAGVDLAIGIVELALKRYGPPVYIKHEIVHNPTVVADVERLGAITRERVADIPEGAVAVFSAHGSPPSDYEEARQRNITVLDATCPLVTRVHNEAQKFTREGKKVILVGHRGHQEVIGTTGQADMFVYDERYGNEMPDWDTDSEVAVLTQTTLSVKDTANAIDLIKQRFPNSVVRNDICYATTNRQTAATELAKMSEVVLVIGAENSSNCNRLKEVAEAEGVEAYLINGPDELRPEWTRGKSRVGITSGASTPEKAVMAVIDAIPNVIEVKRVGPGEAPITFSLPRPLRPVAEEADFTFSGTTIT